MTTEKAPTPLVDSQTGEHSTFHGIQFVSADFSRQLERESIRLAERLKEAREALQKIDNLVCVRNLAMWGDAAGVNRARVFIDEICIRTLGGTK